MFSTVVIGRFSMLLLRGIFVSSTTFSSDFEEHNSVNFDVLLLLFFFDFLSFFLEFPVNKI